MKGLFCSRSILIMSFLILIFLVITPAHTQGQTVFGPEELKIGWWPTHLSFHKFTVDTPDEGVLVVTKNTPQKRIFRGFVLLNKKYIPLGSFLRGDELVLEREVNLRSTNYLMVFLRGKWGASITLEVKSTAGPIPPPTVSISADPESIILGESTTLSWTSTNADTVTIDQGIGAVDPSGSTIVSPEETTTYTVTATGPEGTATASVTVTVTYPQPTVNISADPESILAEESSTLTWTSTNADSATIDQGIGDVPTSGSTTVSPSETTSYTITVTGVGGTTTASTTVTVIQPPQVNISASPDTISIGQSSTLTWTSTNADTVTIDQGIGEVELSGSSTVSPTETTTYTITATGPGGTATASVTVTVITQSISITSPSDGATISRPDVMVKGTISNPTGNETGVTVNGIVAAVYSDQFAAAHVPLQEGTNTLTATATDTDGNTVSASIIVNAVIPEDYISISADTEMGVSPLETTLRIEGTFSFTTDPSLTYTGPGEIEVLENPTPTEYRVRMTAEGIYDFTTEAVDAQSNIYTDTVTVVVMNKDEFDAMLLAKWEDMKGALKANNVDGALRHFDQNQAVQEKYQDLFETLSHRMDEIVDTMSDIIFLEQSDNVAQYLITRVEDGKEFGYYIYFVRGADGIWRIRSW